MRNRSIQTYVATNIALCLAAALAQASSSSPTSGERDESSRQMMETSGEAVIRLADATASFNLPEQPLADSLRAIGDQANYNIFFDPKLVAGRKAAALRAQISAEEALKQLLKDSGLTYRHTDEKTFTIVSEKVAANDQPTAQNPSPATGDGKLRLAQAEGHDKDSAESNSSLSDQAATAGEGSSSDSQLKEFDTSGIPEILVRGKNDSFSLNADIERTRDDIQPYVVFDQAQIQNSGASDIDSFLRTRLTMNYVSSPSNQSAFGSGSNSQVSLRGLSSYQTLILIDGRRAPPLNSFASDAQPDLNGIPLSAIERIEVLPVTASGIYGGSATGGVINVVLKRSFTAHNVGVRYDGTILGGGARRKIDFNTGFSANNGTTSVILNGSYADADPLLVRQRDYIEERRSIAAGRTPPSAFASLGLGRTTNMCSASVFFGFPFCNQNNLVLKPEFGGTTLSSSTASVPDGYSGIASDGGAALIANAGIQNAELANTAQLEAGSEASILNNPTVKSLSATLRQRLNSSVEVFIELSGSENNGAYRINRLNGDFVVSSLAPNNPFTSDLLVITPAFGADGTRTNFYKNERVVVGVVASISPSWSAEVDFAYGRSVSESTSPQSQADPADVARILSGDIDVLRDTNLYPIDLSAALRGREVSPPASLRAPDFTARLGGEVGQLGGGRIGLTVLAEHRSIEMSETSNVIERGGTRTQTYGYSGNSRDIDSVYAEARLPIVSDANATRGMRLLEFQLASRYDAYHTVGSVFLDPSAEIAPRPRSNLSSFNPTIGARYAPISGIILRASYGTGFLPPNAADLLPTPPLPQFPFGVTDPKRGNEPLGLVLVSSGGNPNVKPEQSKSISAGIVFNPIFVPSLRLSLDWSRIEKTNNLTTIFLDQDGLNNEDLLPGLVQRAPAIPGDGFPVGPIIGFDGSSRNAASATYEAYDLSVDYVRETGRFGSWRARAAATELERVSQKVSPAASIVDDVGIAVPKWAANASLEWTLRSFTLGWQGQLLDSYWLNREHTVEAIQGSAKVQSMVYHDIFGRFSLRNSSWRAVSGLEFIGGIKNVLNEKPRFSSRGANYSDGWTSPEMAIYYLTVRKSF